jgi:type II secretory pathway pseudopilin PulG
MRLNNRGDTIVEVIMAIAIVGLIVASSFSIANRSLLGVRDAQEHTEALKIAEGQLEKVKTLADTNFASISITPNIYCIADDLSIKQMTSVTSLPPRTSPNFPPYVTAGCVDSTNIYHYAIQYAGPPQDVFTVSVQWDRVGGGQTNEVSLVYKVHKL